MLLKDNKTRPDPKSMRAAAKQLGVKAPKQTGAEADKELLGLIRIELAKRMKGLKEEDTIVCTVCEELSTEDTQFCPYCGDKGKDPPGPIEVVDSIPAGAKRVTPVPSKPSSKPAARVSSAPPKPSSAPPKPSSAPPARGVGIAKTPVPVAGDVSAALATRARDLDARISRIHELKNSAVALSYDIGLELKEIRDQQLFKARGHLSFKDFAQKELPFTRVSALQLISICDKWSREDFASIGFAKLRLLSAVPDKEQKEELVEAAKQGATRADLRERIAAGTPGSKRPPAPEKGEKITLLGKIGARNQSVKFHDADTGEVIESAGVFKSYNTQAYGELEISEGVFVRIGLRVTGKSELEGLSVRFVRATGDAE